MNSELRDFGDEFVELAVGIREGTVIQRCLFYRFGGLP